MRRDHRTKLAFTDVLTNPTNYVLPGSVEFNRVVSSLSARLEGSLLYTSAAVIQSRAQTLVRSRSVVHVRGVLVQVHTAFLSLILSPERVSRHHSGVLLSFPRHSPYVLSPRCIAIMSSASDLAKTPYLPVYPDLSWWPSRFA
jgi:hypothetical protein